MLYAFGRMLARKLPRRGEDTEVIDLSEDVALKYCRIQKSGDGAIDIIGKVGPPTKIGTGGQETPEIDLSMIRGRPTLH